MSKTKSILSIIVLLLATLACNFIAPTKQPTPPPPTVIPELTVIVEPTSSLPTKVPITEAEVPRIPVELALTALQSGAAVIVDVRSEQAYETSHIEGAISIPLGEIEANPNGFKFNKDQWIITYCT